MLSLRVLNKFLRPSVVVVVVVGDEAHTDGPAVTDLRARWHHRPHLESLLTEPPPPPEEPASWLVRCACSYWYTFLFLFYDTRLRSLQIIPLVPVSFYLAQTTRNCCSRFITNDETDFRTQHRTGAFQTFKNYLLSTRYKLFEWKSQHDNRTKLCINVPTEKSNYTIV